MATVTRLFLLIIFLPAAFTAAADPIAMFVGTGGEGIYRTELDPDSGELSDPVMVAKTPRPTFLWIDSETRHLYSVSELYGDARGGPAIVAWSIGSDGQLERINQQDTRGNGPCFVSVRDDGRYAAVANYGSGSISLFPIRDDGSLDPASGHVQHRGSSVNRKRQQAPHAHSIRFDPSGKRVVAADLGTDNVYLYDIGSDGTLSPSEPASIRMPAGSGPRHLTFSSDGNTLLVLGELGGTITVLRYAPPNVEILETISTMDDDASETAPRGSAEILYAPDGRHVYASNRGVNEIAWFAVDSKTGKLTREGSVSCGGQKPRNFRLSPEGRFLIVANQGSDTLNVFTVDPDDGSLEPTGKETRVPKPMCVKFLAKAG